MKQRQLFVTNTARSGSYLVSMMLSAHRDVMIASEPYLELYRSLRNAAVRRGVRRERDSQFDPSTPIQDYYFRDSQLEVMDLVQAADLDMTFDDSEWKSLLSTCVPRMSLQCAELAPYAHQLKGRTYREMFDNGLRIVAEARCAHNRRWLGIKDAWTIEFFTPFARAYPNAKFLTILRDPRAVVNSMLGVVRIDPSQVGQVMSYLRHWRKMVAFHHAFEADPLFRGHLHLVRHEDVVHQPERTCRSLCEFLDIDFDARMLDTSNYIDHATGGVWKGNSSFEAETQGISAHRAERWRSMLPSEIVAVTELMCGPEMEACGYELLDASLGLAGPATWPDAAILDYLLRASGEYVNWRTDLGDLQQDFGYELFRRALLALPNRDGVDAQLLRRSFLFEASYDRLHRCRDEGSSYGSTRSANRAGRDRVGVPSLADRR
jgi:hypothetical protein